MVRLVSDYDGVWKRKGVGEEKRGQGEEGEEGKQICEHFNLKRLKMERERETLLLAHKFNGKRSRVFSRPVDLWEPRLKKKKKKATEQMKNGPQHRKSYDYNLYMDRWHRPSSCLQPVRNGDWILNLDYRDESKNLRLCPATPSRF